MYTDIKIEEINLVNLATKESLFLSESGNSYVLDGIPDWGAVTADINFVGYVNQIGSQKTATSLGTRDITINGWVVASGIDDMKRKKKFLNHFINPLQDMRCEYEGYYIDFTPEKSVKYSTDYSKNNEIVCNFQIEGVCGVPLFANTKKTVISQSPTYAVPVFPMIIPENVGTILGRAGDGSRRIIDNTGAVDTWFELTITCLEGTIKNPKVTLGEDSQVFIKIATELSEGDTLFLSTEYGNETVTVTKENGAVTDLMTKVTRDSELFLLGQGKNVVIVSDDSSSIENIDFKIEFSPLYMEVQ